MNIFNKTNFKFETLIISSLTILVLTIFLIALFIFLFKLLALVLLNAKRIKPTGKINLIYILISIYNCTKVFFIHLIKLLIIILTILFRICKIIYYPFKFIILIFASLIYILNIIRRIIFKFTLRRWLTRVIYEYDFFRLEHEGYAFIPEKYVWRIRHFYQRWINFINNNKIRKKHPQYATYFLFGYLCRYSLYSIYLSVYYILYIIKYAIFHIFKAELAEVIFFSAYFISKLISIKLLYPIYKLVYYIYNWIKKQVYYLLPNYLVYHLVEALNLPLFKWYSSDNVDDNAETPEYITMNPHKISPIWFQQRPIDSVFETNKLDSYKILLKIFWLHFILIIVYIPILFIVIILTFLIFTISYISDFTLLISHYFIRKHYNIIKNILHFENIKFILTLKNFFLQSLASLLSLFNTKVKNYIMYIIALPLIMLYYSVFYSVMILIRIPGYMFYIILNILQFLINWKILLLFICLLYWIDYNLIVELTEYIFTWVSLWGQEINNLVALNIMNSPFDKIFPGVPPNRYYPFIKDLVETWPFYIVRMVTAWDKWPAAKYLRLYTYNSYEYWTQHYFDKRHYYDSRLDALYRKLFWFPVKLQPWEKYPVATSDAHKRWIAQYYPEHTVFTELEYHKFRNKKLKYYNPRLLHTAQGVIAAGFWDNLMYAVKSYTAKMEDLIFRRRYLSFFEKKITLTIFIIKSKPFAWIELRLLSIKLGIMKFYLVSKTFFWGYYCLYNQFYLFSSIVITIDYILIIKPIQYLLWTNYNANMKFPIYYNIKCLIENIILQFILWINLFINIVRIKQVVFSINAENFRLVFNNIINLGENLYIIIIVKYTNVNNSLNELILKSNTNKFPYSYLLSLFYYYSPINIIINYLCIKELIELLKINSQYNVWLFKNLYIINIQQPLLLDCINSLIHNFYVFFKNSYAIILIDTASCEIRTFFNILCKILSSLLEYTLYKKNLVIWNQPFEIEKLTHPPYIVDQDSWFIAVVGEENLWNHYVDAIAYFWDDYLIKRIGNIEPISAIWDMWINVINNRIAAWIKGITYWANTGFNPLWWPLIVTSKIQIYLDTICINLQWPRRAVKNKINYSYTPLSWVLRVEYLINGLVTNPIRRRALFTVDNWKLHNIHLTRYFIGISPFIGRDVLFTRRTNWVVPYNGWFVRNPFGLAGSKTWWLQNSKVLYSVMSCNLFVYYITISLLALFSNGFSGFIFINGSPNVDGHVNREFAWTQFRENRTKELVWDEFEYKNLSIFSKDVIFSNSMRDKMILYKQVLTTKLSSVNSSERQIINLLISYLDESLYNQVKDYEKEKYISPTFLAFYFNQDFDTFRRNVNMLNETFVQYIAYGYSRDEKIRTVWSELDDDNYIGLIDDYTHDDAADKRTNKIVEESDKLFKLLYNLDKNWFNLELRSWAWHKDLSVNRILNIKQIKYDTRTQSSGIENIDIGNSKYEYENDEESYIPYGIICWFIAVPAALLVKPYFTISGFWTHFNRSPALFSIQLSRYTAVLMDHIQMFRLVNDWFGQDRFSYKRTGGYISLSYTNVYDYDIYHIFYRRFFQSSMWEDYVSLDGLIGFGLDSIFNSSLEELRRFYYFNTLLATIYIIYIVICSSSNKKSTNRLNSLVDSDINKIYLLTKKNLKRMYLWFWQ